MKKILDNQAIERVTDHTDLLLDRRGRNVVIDMITTELNLDEAQSDKLRKVYKKIRYQDLRTKFPEIVPYILRYIEDKQKEESIEYDLPVVRALLAINKLENEAN